MPFVLRECTESNQSHMDAIWNSVWALETISKKLQEIHEDDLLPIFLKYLPQKGKILEAGCGLGQWVIFLKNKGYDILGIDFAKEAIQTITKSFPSAPVEEGNIVGTRFPGNYFDAYISLGVVEHFADGPELPLREARRILKTDGLLLVSVPVFNNIRKMISCFEYVYNFLSENNFIRKVLGKSKYPQKRFIEYRYTIRELERILKDEGFCVVGKFPLLHDYFGLFNHFLEPPWFLSRRHFMRQFFDGLAKIFEKFSPWIAPHQVIWICKKTEILKCPK